LVLRERKGLRVLLALPVGALAFREQPGRRALRVRPLLELKGPRALPDQQEPLGRRELKASRVRLSRALRVKRGLREQPESLAQRERSGRQALEATRALWEIRAPTEILARKDRPALRERQVPLSLERRAQPDRRESRVRSVEPREYPALLARRESRDRRELRDRPARRGRREAREQPARRARAETPGQLALRAAPFSRLICA
jgi:hypothetical protein